MSEIGVFEHPFNERFRLFLRVEQIFEQIDHHLSGEHYWDTHAALQAILELLQSVSRGDSKRELIKELDRQRAIATAEGSGKAARFDQLLSQLHARTGTLGAELAENELIQQLKQRTTASGRPGVIGLASYQEWLQRPAGERHQEMHGWLQPLQPARNAIDLCLGHLRQSAAWQPLESSRGFYEQALDPREPMQLLRVRMTETSGRFPEVSAGRQRFTIRFFEQRSAAERASQVEGSVSFEIAFCGFS